MKTRRKDKPLIYLAGPYTFPDPSANTHKAIQMANFLVDQGFYPFVPHLFHFWHTVTPRPYEDWTDIDNVFLLRCDALFRMEGESKGSDEEVKLANDLGIPVFYSVNLLLSHFPYRRKRNGRYSGSSGD